MHSLSTRYGGCSQNNMKSPISFNSKVKQGRGTGTGADYLPWIKAREINSLGVTHNIVDWKHGRTVELLSEGEAWLYYILRWDDNVDDIREQYPLDLDTTNDIADKASIMRVAKGQDCMTTDLLVTRHGGKLEAYSIKASKTDLANPRTLEKLWIEKMYWNLKGTPWKLVYKEDMNSVYADNIRLCVEYYDENRVHDETSAVKHYIAIKTIKVDMETAPLNFNELTRIYGGKVWQNRKVLP